MVYELRQVGKLIKILHKKFIWVCPFIKLLMNFYFLFFTGEYVAQFKFTVLLMPTGPLRCVLVYYAILARKN